MMDGRGVDTGYLSTPSCSRVADAKKWKLRWIPVYLQNANTFALLNEKNYKPPRDN